MEYQITNEDGCLNNNENIKPHSDQYFDLDKIPMEVLDKAWTRYEMYLIGLPYRHPLRLVVEEKIEFSKLADYAIEVITKTIPPLNNMLIRKHEGCKGMNTIILSALFDNNADDNNVEVLERVMRKLHFNRSIPDDVKLQPLIDSKNREWMTLVFEPIPSKDEKSPYILEHICY